MSCSYFSCFLGNKPLIHCQGVILPHKLESIKVSCYSRLKVCACRGAPYVGSCDSSHTEASFRNSNNSAGDRVLFSKKYGGASWSCDEPHHLSKLKSQSKIRKHIVVRSELAQAGTPGASFPLSEPQLGVKVRGICFYAITAVAAIILIVFMMVAHPFVLLLDRNRRKFHHLIAKIWATLTVTPFLKVEFVGMENLPSPDTPAVYVSNHQSFLDIYALLSLGRNYKFISKTGIFLFPIIGWAMLMMGTIPLKRMDSSSQLECFKRCMDLIKKGSSVFFFPEGTRSKDGKLGAFKKGAFSVAAKTGVPVVPITLLGTGKIMPLGRETTLGSGTVKVVIHKPIKGNAPDLLCTEARNIIEDTLNSHA